MDTDSLPMEPFEERFRDDLDRVRRLIDEYEAHPERFRSFDDVESGPILRRLGGPNGRDE